MSDNPLFHDVAYHGFAQFAGFRLEMIELFERAYILKRDIGLARYEMFFFQNQVVHCTATVRMVFGKASFQSTKRYASALGFLRKSIVNAALILRLRHPPLFSEAGFHCAT